MCRNYGIQVACDHYFQRSYLNADRWSGYWHQIEGVLQLGGQSILEIGIGNRVVCDMLAKMGLSVTTLDIEPGLHPDAIGSTTLLPFAAKVFDVVLAAEILEHIAWEDLPLALAEIRRVTRRAALISLPNAGYTFACDWKLPLIRRQRWVWRLPRFWSRHRFDGEHYWELGKRGYSLDLFVKVLQQSGFCLVGNELWPDDPVHNYFLLELAEAGA